ncbi:MAG: hypothetical protein OXS28_07595 [Gammaproteobacteria bacterium]|nr:hypothetical protein [Gammaproteobacteria bacterium]MDE0283780.1 hypothetical protein [Gammaproteobacteria bacterium]
MIITDTHKAIKIIADSGVPDEQAEAIVSAMNEHGADIVTRDYLDMKLKDQENRIMWKMLALFIAFAALIKWL